jgi:hypothetical protein
MELKMKVMWKSALVLALAMQFCTVACDDPKLSSWADNVWMVQIVVDPMKNQYDKHDVVTLSYVVLDRYGQQIDGIGATWENPAAQDVLAHGNQQFEFIKVGAFTWKVTLEPPFELSDSVILNVPSIPSRVEITVDPDRPNYEVGDQVALDCLVWNQYLPPDDDPPMTGIDVTWQNPAPGGIQHDGNQEFTFIQEGQFTWICSLTADPAINDTRTLTVDGTGPVVVFEVPERGDTILKTGPNAEITVSGTVTDVPSGVNKITIHTNAMAATEVTPQGDAFSLVTPAVPGLNVVVAEAEDSVGNISTTTRAYHYSSDFFAYENDTQLRTLLDDVLYSLLTDAALDFGTPPAYDPCDYDANDLYVCSEIKDVASLLELAVNNVDFTSALPGQNFQFPLVDEQWQFAINADISVKARIEGDLDLDFSFQEIEPGLAKVEQLRSTDGGMHAVISYSTYTDSLGVEHPGLNVDLGMTVTLTFEVFLDVTAADIPTQLLMCAAGYLICDGGTCLSDYLESCTANPLPVAQCISDISTPQLIGFSMETMTADVDLDVGLDGTNKPYVTLSDINVSLGQGDLDASVLESLNIHLCDFTIVGMVFPLGDYTLPVPFINDIVSAIIDPLLNLLKPFVETVLSEMFTCRGTEGPVCYLLPFLENLLGGFAVDKDITITNPFDTSPNPQTVASIHMKTEHSRLAFTNGQGGDMDLAGRVDSTYNQVLDTHIDDDLLGIALCDACLQGSTGFGGYNLSGKPIQLAHALDMINMGMFAIWHNGGMDLNLNTAAFNLPGVTDLAVQLRMWLPPMLTSCGMQNEQVLAGAGDTHLTANWTYSGHAYVLHGYANLLVPADLARDASGDGWAITLANQPDFFEIEVTQLTVDGQKADDTARTYAVGFISDEIAPRILDAWVQVGVAQLQELMLSYDISEFLGHAPGTDEIHIGNFEVHQDQNYAIGNGEFVQ